MKEENPDQAGQKVGKGRPQISLTASARAETGRYPLYSPPSPRKVEKAVDRTHKKQRFSRFVSCLGGGADPNKLEASRKRGERSRKKLTKMWR